MSTLHITDIKLVWLIFTDFIRNRELFDKISDLLARNNSGMRLDI